MTNEKQILIGFLTIIFLVFTFLPVFAQHRGDDLAYQGLDFINTNGVKALAMGGAYTSMSGELDALFYNPAGLVGINGFQMSINANSYNKLWRERQDYRPNRQVVTLSFILDGLYTPKPDYNGWYDYEVFLDDSTYTVNDPILGEDPYGEESADWQKKIRDSGINNIVAALPFKLLGKKFVLSAGYSNQVLVTNYDRNQTYLDPHPAYDGYGEIPDRVTSVEDSLRINWYNYERERTGPLTNISSALSVALNNHLKLGLGINILSGKTDDFHALKKIGYFDLVEGYNVYRFSYDTSNVITKGSSSYAAAQFNIGAIVNLGKLNLGANFTLPYKIKREYDYTIETFTPDTTNIINYSNNDEMKIPFSFAFGLSINPISKFTIAFDLKHRPFKNAEFILAANDSTHRDWIDQTSFGIGVEYKPFDFLSILGGYKNIPQVFIPDGAAIKDRGPEADCYTMGISAKIPYGRLDIAYEIRILKYYDVYYSNTNWAYESFKNISFGYTFIL